MVRTVYIKLEQTRNYLGKGIKKLNILQFYFFFYKDGYEQMSVIKTNW